MNAPLAEPLYPFGRRTPAQANEPTPIRLRQAADFPVDHTPALAVSIGARCISLYVRHSHYVGRMASCAKAAVVQLSGNLILNSTDRDGLALPQLVR